MHSLSFLSINRLEAALEPALAVPQGPYPNTRSEAMKDKRKSEESRTSETPKMLKALEENPLPKMEAEYDKGVSQNQVIAQGIKSAYIEILCDKSKDTVKETTVVNRCVSNVYEHLLTYKVSVWEENTTPNGSILHLGLYVVWNGLPQTTPIRASGTVQKYDDTHAACSYTW